MKIAILNQKGGAGKTTIALHNIQVKLIMNRKIVNTAITKQVKVK